MRSFALLPLLMCFLLGCKPALKISGHPASYWIEQLNDRNPAVQSRAIENLALADKSDVEKARKRLDEISSQGSVTAQELVELKFGYLHPDLARKRARDSSYLLKSNEDGRETLRKLFITHSDAVLKGLDYEAKRQEMEILRLKEAWADGYKMEAANNDLQYIAHFKAALLGDTSVPSFVSPPPEEVERRKLESIETDRVIRQTDKALKKIQAMEDDYDARWGRNSGPKAR